ncbi:sirohydrochlorin chelatase [Caldinitratiruptor microaerophilus]|uniref:Cobalamin biosynthesis protein CbiX n=1 Tax=Caldinitratiruptor microaerophilus TaxID=671077 RepID=A0AA35CPM9_9FIRM|nr:sirohydrochlorin chelatase [Caldinitratiruptor microaerophilus]BDG61556.1 cobalamin biosynthesis protein CbiX [Caldinitratiruptor microaerophilus]
MKQRGLLLVGHGSRDPEGNAQFLRVVERAARLPRVQESGWRVQPSFIELANPEVPEGIDALVAAGCQEVVTVPLTLFAAGHAKEEIPGHLEAARERHPGVVFRYGRPIGVEPAVIPILLDHLAAARPVAGAGDAGRPAEPIADPPAVLVLVGRGSSDPEANSDFYKVGRLLWEALRAGGGPLAVDWVELCFIGVTVPDLDTALRRTVALGARQVVVLPYFLFTGVLVKRIARITADWARRSPGVAFWLAGLEGVGEHPRFLPILGERIEEAAAARPL